MPPTEPARGRAGIFPPIPVPLAAMIGSAAGLWAAAMVWLSLAVPVIR